MKTSPVSRATSASRSADSQARANLATIASSAGEPAAGGGWWPAAAGCRALEAGAGSLEGAGDRSGGHLQHLGHLAGPESEDVAQDQDCDLARRQQLQGSHEGQRDGFGLLIAGLRPGRPAEGTGEEGVRKRLQPDGLIPRDRLELRHVLLPGLGAARRPARVQAPVRGDLVQPGAQPGRAFLSEPADALPGGQHRLLDGVLGVGEGSEHPVAVHLQLPPVDASSWNASPSPARARASRSAVTILRSFLPRHVVPPPGLYTPPAARTGRLAGAQFPGAAVYALPTARDDPPARTCRSSPKRPWKADNGIVHSVLARAGSWDAEESSDATRRHETSPPLWTGERGRSWRTAVAGKGSASLLTEAS